MSFPWWGTNFFAPSSFSSAVNMGFSQPPTVKSTPLLQTLMNPSSAVNGKSDLTHAAPCVQQQKKKKKIKKTLNEAEGYLWTRTSENPQPLKKTQCWTRLLKNKTDAENSLNVLLQEGFHHGCYRGFFFPSPHLISGGFLVIFKWSISARQQWQEKQFKQRSRD